MLILDDWDIAPLDDAERRELIEIIEERHGGARPRWLLRAPRVCAAE